MWYIKPAKTVMIKTRRPTCSILSTPTVNSMSVFLRNREINRDSSLSVIGWRHFRYRKGEIIHKSPIRTGEDFSICYTSDTVKKLWICSSNLSFNDFFYKKGRTQHIVVRLLFRVLRYLDISQSKTMSLNTILITSKFDLQKFTLSCQYMQLSYNSYMLWLS